MNLKYRSAKLGVKKASHFNYEFHLNEDTEDERDGYEVDPKLLGGL